MDHMIDARQRRSTLDNAVTIVLPVESSRRKAVEQTRRKLKAPDLLRSLNDSAIYYIQRILENILSLRQKHNMQIIGMTSAHSHAGTSTITAVLSLLAAARQNSHTSTQKNGSDDLSLSAKAKMPFQNILLI